MIAYTKFKEYIWLVNTIYQAVGYRVNNYDAS